MSSSHNRVNVINGVNLDQLGSRDPELYGDLTLTELDRQVGIWARELKLEATFFQTNSEAEMVEHLHRVPHVSDSVIINAGAWTHYSWAIRDALEIAGVPTVEVHLSDVMAREPWRHHSVFDGLVLEVISGKGPDGYHEALRLLAGKLDV